MYDRDKLTPAEEKALNRYARDESKKKEIIDRKKFVYDYKKYKLNDPDNFKTYIKHLKKEIQMKKEIIDRKKFVYDCKKYKLSDPDKFKTYIEHLKEEKQNRKDEIFLQSHADTIKKEKDFC